MNTSRTLTATPTRRRKNAACLERKHHTTAPITAPPSTDLAAWARTARGLA